MLGYLLPIPYLILYLLYRALLTLAVRRSAESKALSTTGIWTVFTGFFGATAAVVYAIFANTGATQQPAKKRQSVAFALLILPVALLTVFYTQAVYLPKSAELEQASLNAFGDDVVTYVDNNGNEVVYDKMGNAYTFAQYDNNEFKYYAKDGLTYCHYYDESEDETGSGTYGIMCLETGEKYELLWGDDEFFIGEDGYLYRYPGDEQCKTWNIYSTEDDMMDSIYYTKDGMLMYSLDDCNWDKDGNLVLDDDYAYKNLTFDSIPKSELYWIEEE